MFSDNNDDGPSPCKKYLGRRTKNKPGILIVWIVLKLNYLLGGSDLTVEEFMMEQSQGWYNHYKNLPAFKDTIQTYKIKGLLRYLAPRQCYGFKATRAKVKEMLEAIQKVEEGVAKGGETVDDNMEEEMGQEEAEQIGEVADGGEKLSMNVGEASQYRTKFKYLQKTDEELFGDTNVPEVVKKAHKYKERKVIWNEKKASDYVKDKSSSEMIQELGRTPQHIKDTKKFKERISKLSSREKSRSLIADSVDEVVEALKKNPTTKNKELVKVIAAAVTSNKYVVVTVIMNLKYCLFHAVMYLK